MWDKPPPLKSLQDTIADPSYPIGMRMRAAYYLRQAYSQTPNGDDDDDHFYETEGRCNKQCLDDAVRSEHKVVQKAVVDTLASGLLDARHGSLMRHEFAYVLGQLRDGRCCDALEKILLNDSDCVMVRHEAAEALGAIGSESSMSSLQKVMAETSTPPELAETCLLAIRMMEWRSAQRRKDVSGDGSDAVEDVNDDLTPPVYCACMTNPYSTVDPAPPHPSHATKTMRELGDILCDANKSIFDRYRAMFSLRNRGGVEAVQELCRALVQDRSSALLRHEVAYVLGQLQHPDSVDALAESLSRANEHFMVRHESAEALGAIEGGRWDEVESILKKFSNDPQVVVRESCLVALDAADYWGHATTDEQTLDEEEHHEGVEYPNVSFAQQKAIVPDVTSSTKKWYHHFNVDDSCR